MIKKNITLVRSNESKNDSFFDPKTDPKIANALRKHGVRFGFMVDYERDDVSEKNGL